MATVEVSFTPLPAHVRTARLVATAVARRSGVPESLLDEVRLAVGEACSRAVEAHQRHCPAVPVHIRLTRADDRFEVTVTDAAPADAGSAAATGGAGSWTPPVPAQNGTAVVNGSASSGAPGSVGLSGSAGATGENGAGAVNGSASDVEVASGVSLAVIAGLADDVHIARTDAGLTIAMTWNCRADAGTVTR